MKRREWRRQGRRFNDAPQKVAFFSVNVVAIDRFVAWDRRVAAPWLLVLALAIQPLLLLRLLRRRLENPSHARLELGGRLDMRRIVEQR
jgi:hypothetical protein